MNEPLARDPWRTLRSLTQARIALGRSGVSVPTGAQLAFQLAHAQARDAVHTQLDTVALGARLQAAGLPVLQADSACADRATYLQRPDLGRVLAPASAQALGAAARGPVDLALVAADGLSALAIEQNLLPFLDALLPLLEGWSLAPLVLVRQGRVAIGDQIGALLQARCVLVLIGERPGLSSPDSMGLYMTWEPRPSLTDAARNCISNVRPAGLGYLEAARRQHYLLTEARRRGLSGIALKDDTAAPAPALGRNFLLA